MTVTIAFTTDDEANDLLAENRFAFLVGMVLYQQVPVEKAFAGPHALQVRLGRTLQASTVAATDPETLEAVFREKPALHRFPTNMAKRTQAMASKIVDTYAGDPDGIWSDGDARTVLERLEELPGFGEYKARVTLGVLVRRYGIDLDGAEPLLPDWPSIADVEKPEDLSHLKVRKKMWKDAQAS